MFTTRVRKDEGSETNRKKIGFFLDDERKPAHVTWCCKIKNVEWRIAKDYNSAIALVEKYNRYHGLDWDAEPNAFKENEETANITISCVDNVPSRKIVLNSLIKSFYQSEESRIPFFWIDCGNGYDYGQVIISEIARRQIKSKIDTKPKKTFFDVFGKNVKDNNTEASCSLLESLGKQNLFINKFIANLAVNWLYESIRTTGYDCLGYHFNFKGLHAIPLD